MVGDKVLVSTLQPPSSDFGTGPNVTEGAEGLTLTVAKPGTYTYSEPNNASPIPINGFEVHVALDDSAAGNLYFGIACRGMDINNTYLLLFNATGKWVIVQVKGGNQTPLAQGTDTSMKSGTIHVLDAACVTAGDNQNQVSLAIDSSIVGQATGSASDVPASNVVALFAYSQDSSSTGSVTFGSITVYRAQI